MAVRRRRRASRPGPKPSITLAVVRRVSSRVGRGLTLALALAAEQRPKINEETWKKALQSHPEFSPLYEAGKGKFLDGAVKRLSGHKDAKFLCWLLERRHADLFARPAGVAVNVEAKAEAHAHVAAPLPAELVERARAIALEESKVPSPKKGDGGK